MPTLLHTPTPDLAQSLDFYQRLQFQRIPHPEKHYVSDGKCLIYINPDRFARAGLQLHGDHWQDLIPALEKLTAVPTTDSGYLLGTPSGTRVYLNKGELDLEMDLAAIPPSHLGNFAGLSLETTDMERSARLWEALGFKLFMGSVEQGWVGFQNEDEFTVSLMQPNSCPHLFFNPSLTYFNGKNNPAVIEKVRAAGITITEEITHFNKNGEVDNIIIRDPGGYGFFLFND
ncbi:VOC family protein [Flavilitoribacter nigricans]|uniref:VOC domain-containing protein n=1 Tax=Flavilitoribacter nigricans (strain ATCC 23147 / DSM 23189 / NBRC 102662 / NCIMB 1420 / SS-2) TaxID=1122177 RepID=A0A2D0NGM8_FLAN2|nr:VOC family protein [Flavilitoribacter nigricans]PHN07645.1 hypothetical protein CRP01_05975 [Flavilitoribacter nigricans DSM 23189 = NBRC 102662]